MKAKRRIQAILTELPEDGEREIYHVAFKLTDEILAEAREWLIRGDPAATRDCVSTAESLISSH